MMSYERKSVRLDAIEVKADTEKRTIQLYSSIFGNEDSYGDVVNAGAFLDSLEEKKEGESWRIPLLWQHSSRDVIGYPVVLHEDSKGLFSEDKIPDTGVGCLGTKALILASTPALWGASIGYSTKKVIWDEENQTSELLALDLWERSVVTFPANEDARIQGVKRRNGIDIITPQLAVKIGRVLTSVKLARFEQAVGLLEELLSSHAATIEEETKGAPAPDHSESSGSADSDAMQGLSESIASWKATFAPGS